MTERRRRGWCAGYRRGRVPSGGGQVCTGGQRVHDRGALAHSCRAAVVVQVVGSAQCATTAPAIDTFVAHNGPSASCAVVGKQSRPVTNTPNVRIVVVCPRGAGCIQRFDAELPRAGEVNGVHCSAEVDGQQRRVRVADDLADVGVQSFGLPVHRLQHGIPAELRVLRCHGSDRNAHQYCFTVGHGTAWAAILAEHRRRRGRGFRYVKTMLSWLCWDFPTMSTRRVTVGSTEKGFPPKMRLAFRFNCAPKTFRPAGMMLLW